MRTFVCLRDLAKEIEKYNCGEEILSLPWQMRQLLQTRPMANYLAPRIRWQWSQQSRQRPLSQPGSALAGLLAELLYNIFWFSHSFKLSGRPWPSPRSLDHNEESHVLVNLPAPFPLQPWEGNRNGCCLCFGFPLTSFEFNLESEICGFWQMVFAPFLPFSPDLIPCSS